MAAALILLILSGLVLQGQQTGLQARRWRTWSSAFILDALDLLDMSYLEQIAPAGVKVTVAETEKKVQDIRIK